MTYAQTATSDGSYRSEILAELERSNRLIDRYEDIHRHFGEEVDWDDFTDRFPRWYDEDHTRFDTSESQSTADMEQELARAYISIAHAANHLLVLEEHFRMHSHLDEFKRDNEKWDRLMDEGSLPDASKELAPAFQEVQSKYEAGRSDDIAEVVQGIVKAGLQSPGADGGNWMPDMGDAPVKDAKVGKGSKKANPSSDMKELRDALPPGVSPGQSGYKSRYAG